MSLKDYIGPKTPRKDWTNEQWLEHAQTMVHSPWISEDDREYWKHKIIEFRK